MKYDSTQLKRRTYSIKFFFWIPHIFIVIFGHKINIWMKLVPWTRQYFSSRHHDFFFVVVFNFFFLCLCCFDTIFIFHLVMIFGGFLELRRFTLKANNTAALNEDQNSRMSNFVNLTNFFFEKEKINRSVYTTRVVG